LRDNSKEINYDAKFINKIKATLVKINTKQKLIIDCSHKNFQKNHKNQFIITTTLAKQININEQNIINVMIESNINKNEYMSAFVS